MPKKQTELDGFARPVIEGLDAKVADYITKREAHRVATIELTAAKASLNGAMHENEETLPENANGDPVYVYHDGDAEHACVLRSSDTLKVEKLSADNDPEAAIG